MPVYKDECVYTFDTQESPYGIDVCLSCFIGTSPDPGHDFTTQHFRTVGHSAFLNFKKEELPENNEMPTQAKPGKLAIESSNHENNFKQSITFKSLAEDREDEFIGAIDKVKSADSYNKAKESEAWELELQPCEHVAIHESSFAGKPPAPLSSDTLSQCAQCELSTNLWICLECGQISCGRRQIDGSGGNGHALAHYEQTQHSLAAKLGSITPEGHVDIYCYSCNDDVNDPLAKNHLGHWGINIATQIKTEKSMTEMQLEQNMNWDFSTQDGAESVVGKGFTGLKNLGNSCYMNSTLQCFFAIPNFAAAFAANDPNSDVVLNPEDLRVQLNKLKDGLTSGRYDVVAPQMLKYLLGRGHEEFATARQQDAFEYLSYLLSKISEQVDPDLPEQLFGFQTERRLACLNCDVVRYKQENEESLSVPVPIEENDEGGFKPVEFTELLEAYTAPETVDSKCPACGGSTAVSTIQFKTLPQTLIVNARRFRLKNWVPEKIDVPVVIPASPLKLDKFISKGPQPEENVIEEAAIDEDHFEANQEQLVQLQSMGFETDHCIVALKLASERGLSEGVIETAAELLMSGEAQQIGSSKKQKTSSVNPVDKATLASMGFSDEQAEAALAVNHSNVEASIDWLFGGNFESYVKTDNDSKLKSSSNASKLLGDASLPALYELGSVVCHKGASVHVGHYVAAIKKDEQMYLFNDEKITKGNDAGELQKFAYIYVFRRV